MVATIGLACLAALRGEHLWPARIHLCWLLFAAAINVFVWMGFTAVSLRWLYAGLLLKIIHNQTADTPTSD